MFARSSAPWNYAAFLRCCEISAVPLDDFARVFWSSRPEALELPIAQFVVGGKEFGDLLQKVRAQIGETFRVLVGLRMHGDRDQAVIPHP